MLVPKLSGAREGRGNGGTLGDTLPTLWRSRAARTTLSTYYSSIPSCDTDAVREATAVTELP